MLLKGRLPRKWTIRVLSQYVRREDFATLHISVFSLVGISLCSLLSSTRGRSILGLRRLETYIHTYIHIYSDCPSNIRRTVSVQEFYYCFRSGLTFELSSVHCPTVRQLAVLWKLETYTYIFGLSFEYASNSVCARGFTLIFVPGLTFELSSCLLFKCTSAIRSRSSAGCDGLRRIVRHRCDWLR